MQTILSVQIPRRAEDGTDKAKWRWMDALYHQTIAKPVFTIPTVLSAGAAIATIRIVAGPSSADQYAAVGALVGSVITTIGVLKFDQNWLNATCSVLGSFTMGVLCPRLVVSTLEWFGWLNDGNIQHVTWNAYALAGLIFSIIGWPFCQSLYKLANKAFPNMEHRLLDKAEKFFGPSDTK